MHRVCLMVVFGIATVFAPSLVGAAIVVALDEASLTQRVDTVALGSVLKTTVEVSPRGSIVTRARIQVVRSLKGASAGHVIEILLPGGVLPNGRASSVAGAPTLKSGDFVLGFYEAREGYQVPWGLSFGLLRVNGNPTQGFRVTRDVSGLSLVSEIGQEIRASAVAISDEPLELLWKRLERSLLEPPETTSQGEGSVR